MKYDKLFKEVWFKDASVVIFPEKEGEEAFTHGAEVSHEIAGDQDYLFFNDGLIGDFLTQPVIVNNGKKDVGLFIPFDIEKKGLEWTCNHLNAIRDGNITFDDISYFNKK